MIFIITITIIIAVAIIVNAEAREINIKHFAFLNFWKKSLEIVSNYQKFELFFYLNYRLEKIYFKFDKVLFKVKIYINISKINYSF